MKDIKKNEFFAKFRFDHTKSGCVGVEREQFVTDPYTDEILPVSWKYLRHLASLNGEVDHSMFQFGYELSACQLESKVGPCDLKDLGNNLLSCEELLRGADCLLNLKRVNVEVAPADMPLCVFPDPTGRYHQIVKNMSHEVLEAACRVAATHIHIGMPDFETALSVYNKVIPYVEHLCVLGDHSGGQRMRLYQRMASQCTPVHIQSIDDFFRRAEESHFVDDPRKCWTLIRISIHGTIEFRMFGATNSIDEIVNWADTCHALCF